MKFSSLPEQFLLTFVRGHTFIAAVVALALLSFAVALISPLIYPLPIPYTGLGVVVYAPVSFISGNEYEILARGLVPGVDFDIAEGNSQVTIMSDENFSDITTKKSYRIRVSANPEFWSLETVNLLVSYRMANRGGLYTLVIPIDKFSLPIRLLMTILVSAPSVMIMNYLREKILSR